MDGGELAPHAKKEARCRSGCEAAPQWPGSLKSRRDPHSCKQSLGFYRKLPNQMFGERIQMLKDQIGFHMAFPVRTNKM